MKISGKVILTIAVVVALALALIYAQVTPNRAASYKLDARQMELLVSEVLPPAQQQQLASNPEQKKQLALRLKELLAIAQLAEAEGFGKRGVADGLPGSILARVMAAEEDRDEVLAEIGQLGVNGAEQRGGPLI